ncbi:tRNA (adenosine(37)-N6)-threonylcarbamoyltransferase complex ATPase subunit type 1 TsaE [Oceanobacillus massiliensis]|uniref:tRNA (adenosine(37)-N6)-threonylcarbamoyltransferase complex ATPase subunit type 1 TsaE n=1 Tax=Oceanobacillus massiliensis TaxID=1465765 RepID=UPI00028A0B7C|nr:tRNA (adenosine(37)-N6)-threonylcarbamoyltransferase complex ATPase subunit type 1 TsaE [Oceanobacillus massiliensis]
MAKIQSDTELETISIAEKLALLLKPGDVVTLEGELGSGKTTFTKGLAKGLGVKRNISSPTFTIIKEYEGEMPFYHMDVYRLENSEEDIGFDEYFHGNGITVVEWAHFIEEFLPEERLEISISYLNEDRRELELTPTGPHFKWVVNELMS